MSHKLHVDYSLYLVTDSGLVPEGTTLLEQVERALEGGTTIVQLREKNLETGPFIALAREVQKLTKRFNVPLIINDRIDVALAIDADGVHVGQDDMPMTQARQILGPKKIIGVSVNTITEAEEAIRAGADYLGVGAVWDTNTKKLTNNTLGIDGVKAILDAVSPIPSVAIGGVKLENALDLLEGAPKLNGLAVVSAIIGSPDPAKTCQEFQQIIQSSLAANNSKSGAPKSAVDSALQFAVQAAIRLREIGPLIHHITNYVVINDNANATLAVGASPFMSTKFEELEDVAKMNGAMVLNMGTLDDIQTMIAASKANAARGNPVIFDPVGAGATEFRKTTTQRFLRECDLTVIKGNGAEILSIAGRGGASRGVDSIGDNGGEANAAMAVKELAEKQGCVVAMTGPIDYVSDGKRVFAIENGHSLLPCITGSGCMVSSIVGCFTAANRNDYLLATVAAILTVTIASELAVKHGDVRGPGTFRSALIDELYKVTCNPQLIAEHAKLRAL
ncbi:Hydroxyethylthiazole kinase family-domain-containing protein [Dichotomocladium elegans]|nr:Hydroxyethylthiazole kinase family-domain-containing protein [Dichotomocladium elegans]